MFDSYVAISLLRPTEPGPQARFREELDREPKVKRAAHARGRRGVDIDGLVARNIQRVGHFIRMA